MMTTKIRNKIRKKRKLGRISGIQNKKYLPQKHNLRLIKVLKDSLEISHNTRVRRYQAKNNHRLM